MTTGRDGHGPNVGLKDKKVNLTYLRKKKDPSSNKECDVRNWEEIIHIKVVSAGPELGLDEYRDRPFK